MSIDLREFYQASDPSRTLFVNNSSDGKYYIDFSSVRGGDILGKLKQKITFLSRMNPLVLYLLGILVVVNRQNYYGYRQNWKS